MNITLKIKGKIKGLAWFNFCLTKDCTLWVFGEQNQHDVVFAKNGIEWQDVLLSGCVRDEEIHYRSSDIKCDKSWDNPDWLVSDVEFEEMVKKEQEIIAQVNEVLRGVNNE